MENSDDQFSLKWNNFQSNLATGFHDLLQEEDMVDVTLAAEGKILYAHKIILSVCSPYFKDLFKVNPCKHPIVILKDVGHQELADMLDFMYRGEASVRQEDLAAFLKLAETLKVKGLAGDKEESSSVPPPQSHRKSSLLVPKKKKVVETAVYEPEEDPGDPDFNPVGEVKRKRKRVSSPQPKTENTSTSATNNSFVPIANPKQEIQEQDEVEFLDDGTSDPLVHFITGKQAKQEDEGNEFDDPNQEMTGDETHDGELDMTAGPSNPDESTEQVPQGVEEKTNKFMVQTPIWDFFKKMTTKTGDVRAVCVVCQKSLRFHNTSVMVRHLRFLHPKAYDSYRNDYIQGRMGVGYHIRGGILGLPLKAPRRTRLKKEKSEERKTGYKEEVKKLIVLKARTKKEESCMITEKDLEQLGQGNIKILNISNKGTIPDVMGEQIIGDLKKGKTCVAVSKFEVPQEEQEIENAEEVTEEEEYSLKEGRQYKFVQVPAEYLEYLKGSGSEVTEENEESVKEGAEVIQILDESEAVVKEGEHSDSELLQIWEQWSPQHGVLVCAVDPNGRRQTAEAGAIEEGNWPGYRPQISPIWNYFDKVNNRKASLCRTCGAVLKGVVTVESDPSRYYYMENQHGLPQLVYNGYVFRRDRERARFSMNRLGESVTRVRSYWRCVLRSCKARGNVDPHGVLRLTNEHDHPPNEEKVKYRNLRAEIKKRALEYNHPPKTILEHFNIKDESLEKTIANWRYRFGSKEGKQSTSTSSSEYYYTTGSKIKLPLTKVEVDGKDSDWKIYMEKNGNEEHVYAATTATAAAAAAAASTSEDEQKEEGIVLEESQEVIFEEEGIIVNDDELYAIEEGSPEHFEKIYYIINKN